MGRVAVVGLLLAAALPLAGCGSAARDEGAAVDPAVLADTEGGRTASFLVVLRRQADVARATSGAQSRDEQGEAALAALRGAARAQAPVARLLRGMGASYRPYWIVNGLVVRGDRAVVDALARRRDVAALEPNRAFVGASAETGSAASAAPRGVEWNVAKIGAPGLWALGFTGQGMVYANADSGVRWDAPALRRQYRGWDGTAADHAYSWWDAVHEDIDGDGGNPCGFSVREPCDDAAAASSHGTHTMGTAVGDDGAGNQVGVAPGARWISCRNMDEGVGRPSTYLECLQFFLAPTDLDGKNPDPSRRPNVIGNSYGCPPDEGCVVGSLQAAFDNLRAAGIFMAVAAGNEGGLGCGSVLFPPGIYDSSVSVGATDRDDEIASFSSRGPVDADGSLRRKPDLSAPGVDVRSVTARGFGVLSGTSMAAPAVGGAVLLLWSALPQLRGNVDATEKLLQDTAVRRTTTNGCGGDTATTVPNNTYGAGRIDVLAAYRAIAAPATVAVADIRVVEGNAGRRSATFTVTLSSARTEPVTVAYATRPRTASAGSDFVTTSGELVFAPGQRSRTVAVPVLGDRRREPNETFALVLSGPSGATLGRATAVATIRDDDADTTKPTLRALSVSPSPVPVGRRGRLSYRASEASRVACTVEQAAGAGWRRLSGFGFDAAPGAHVAALPSAGLTSGRYRVACTPTDRARNVGRTTAAVFRVA